MPQSLPSLDTPLIVTELPGPNARRLIADDERYTSPSYTRIYPLAVERGLGAVIEDVDGNRFLDFTAGIAVCASGHCHPRVVQAIHEQSQRLLHMSGTDFYYGVQGELARKLAEIFPGSVHQEDGSSSRSAAAEKSAEHKKVFFTNSGAEAVEAAIKLARYHTRRQRIIAFHGAFHGRTMGALSLTASKVVQERGFGPLIPGVTHAPYPNPYRSSFGLEEGTSAADCVNYIERVLFKQTVPPDEVAAFVVEPIQGEGGYIVPPDDFHPRLKALAEKHDILYVADEIQTGMGRTGRMFALDHWGVEPDILCLAKGIASGMPLGAIIAHTDTMNWPPGAHASTFGGNPVCCAAALATIALLEEGLTENAAVVGAYFKERLEALPAKHPLVGDVRGKGLMIGIELVRDRKTKEPAVEERARLVERCFQKGLLVLGCGENSIRLSPPLVIDTTQADRAVELLDEALQEVG